MATGVEIINNTAPDGVLDLTGGNGHQPNEGLEDETNKGTGEGEGTGEGAGEGQGEGEGTGTGEGAGEGAGEGEGGEGAGEGEGDGEAEYHFGGQIVNIEVPGEISSALTEAGVDEKTLLGELFAKDGKFELSAETRGKLEAKFGKLMVDGYLNMYKTTNDQTLASHAQQVQQATEQQQQVQSEYKELVGGAEGLGKLEAFIEANFTEKQIASYNAVMSGESWEAQRMVIELAKTQMAQADKLANGDRHTDMNLLGDGTPVNSGSGDITDKGFLTADEYSKIMETDKYWEDKAYMAKIDTMRYQSAKAGK